MSTNESNLRSTSYITRQVWRPTEESDRIDTTTVETITELADGSLQIVERCTGWHEGLRVDRTYTRIVTDSLGYDYVCARRERRR